MRSAASGGVSSMAAVPEGVVSASVSDRIRSRADAPTGAGRVRARGRNGRVVWARWTWAAGAGQHVDGGGAGPQLAGERGPPQACRRALDRAARPGRTPQPLPPAAVEAAQCGQRPRPASELHLDQAEGLRGAEIGRRGRRAPSRCPGRATRRRTTTSPHPAEVRGEGGRHDVALAAPAARSTRTARVGAGGQRVAQHGVGGGRARRSRPATGCAPGRGGAQRPLERRRGRRRRRRPTGSSCVHGPAQRVDLGPQVDPLQARTDEQHRQRQVRRNTTPWPPSG